MSRRRESCCAADTAVPVSQHSQRINSPSAVSPIATVDPLVRALNTFMYGLLVHFGTFWMYGIYIHSVIDGEEAVCLEDKVAVPLPFTDNPDLSPFPWIWCVLLLHEYWVYLQHSNVLANPYCQRLDRQYGIALLKSNQHWAIAGTLSAYWCRESLCMFLCLPFLPNNPSNSSYTKYWITYSLVYHTIKSRGVRLDALRRHSPTFGIMRVVIDKFYLHSKKETILTLVRLLLQGIDTYIHHIIIKDLLLFAPSTSPFTMRWLHVVFGIWVVHAALNQYFRCSTASIMVQAWYSLTARRFMVDPPVKKSHEQLKCDDTRNGESDHSTDDDDATEVESISSRASSSEDDDGLVDEDFIVRKLLRKGRLAEELEGRQGAATDGVDTAVRIETACAILAIVFIAGLDQVPLRALGMEPSTASIFSKETMPVTWLLVSLLHSIWAIFLRGKLSSGSTSSAPSTRAAQRAVVNVLDLIWLIVTALYGHPQGSANVAWPLAVGVTIKSYLQATWDPPPKLFGSVMKILEFGGKLLLLRIILDDGQQALVEMYIVLVWGFWVVISPIPTPCEVASTLSFPRSGESSAADVVFLGHPAELIDFWALWLLPYSLDERWTGPWWAMPLWPIHYLVGLYLCNYRQKWFGDKASFFCCDDINYGATRMQTWTSAHFGRHFVTHRSQVKRNIEAAARHAERTGVRVLCLGALNKSESINGGGVGVVKALGESRMLSIIHGNHLTAAAVVETTVRCFGEKAKVFLTGASSKVGWAVAQALRDRYGYRVLCHSTDAARRKYFEDQGFESSAKISDGTHFSQLWIVGKYDLSVPKLIPQNSTAIVFSVPHSLGGRSDIRVVEAGTLHMDLSKLDRPRQFTNKLRSHEIFACHAASVVANHRLQRDKVPRIDETGPVDPLTMGSWLVDANDLGFQVPSVMPISKCTLHGNPDRPPVIVVGAGPAGLAVAALLVQQAVPVVLVERQSDTTQFGSWEHHFSGLKVTSQKKWCNLPGFAMAPDDFPGEYISAKDYRRYLHLYAARFRLEIRRGISVTGIEKGMDPLRPWIVTYMTEIDGTKDRKHELVASAVIVATGKNREPKRDTNDHLAERLSQAGIPTLHSSELRDEVTWNQATQAAQRGRLAIIGFGNSASDVAASILQRCSSSDSARIHIAARTVPPVFPRRTSVFRVDTIGYLLSRWSPSQQFEEIAVKLLWSSIPSSRQCDAAFPAHLSRWSRIRGRVPVIDKDDFIRSGFQSGRLAGHGPVTHVDAKTQSLTFDDKSHGTVPVNGPGSSMVGVDMVIMATGYCTSNPLVTRADPLNGLFTCGFGNDRFLPLQSIGDEARKIAHEVVADWTAGSK